MVTQDIWTELEADITYYVGVKSYSGKVGDVGDLCEVDSSVEQRRWIPACSSTEAEILLRVSHSARITLQEGVI